MEELVLLRQAFNDQLIKSMMDQMLTNSFMASLGMSILYFCAGIGLFLTLSTFDMKKFIYFVFKLWVVLACVNPSLLGKGSFPMSGNEKLGIFLYHELKGVFDKFAKELNADDGDYLYNVEQLMNIQNKVQDATVACDMETSEGKMCWVKHLNGTYIAEKDDSPPKVGLDAIIDMLKKVYTFFSRAITNMGMLLFPILMFILSLIQAFVTMFVLLGLGITTAFALMMSTLLTPFALLPGKEGTVINMYKMVLATTLFTFVSKFILWISIIITGAIGTATQKTLITTLVGMIQNAGPTTDMASIQVLITANFACIFVLLFFQIVAITKIPQISKDIMNLSLNTLVNLGESLMGAAMGLAQMAGTTLGGAAGGAIGGAMGSMAGAIRGNQASAEGGGDSGSGGSSSSSNSSGSGSGGGSSSVTNNSKIELSSGSTPSVAEVALNSAKGDSILKKPTEAPKESLADKAKNMAKEAVSAKGIDKARNGLANMMEKGTKLGLKGASIASNMFWDNMNAGLAGKGDGLGTMKKGVGVLNKSMDAGKAFDFGGKSSAMIVDKAKGLASSVASSQQSLVQSPKDFALEGGKLQESLKMEKGQFDEASGKEFDDRINRIKQGIGTDGDVEAVYRMQNTFDMTGREEDLAHLNIDEKYTNYAQEQEKDNQDLIDSIRKDNESGKDMSVEDMNIINNRIAAGLMDIEKLKSVGSLYKDTSAAQRHQEHFSDDKVSYRMATKDEAIDANGNLNKGFFTNDNGKTYQEKQVSVAQKDGSSILKNYAQEQEDYKTRNAKDYVNFSDKLNSQNKENTIKTVDSLLEQENLSSQERQALFQTVKNNQSQLFGEKDRLAKIEKKFGGSVDLSHLKKSNEEVEKSVHNYALQTRLQSGEYKSFLPSKNHIEFSLDGGAIIINDEKNPGKGQMITSKAEFDALPESDDKKALRDYFNDINRYESKVEEGNTAQESMAQKVEDHKSFVEKFKK